jgi:peptide/nickel transport system substrate-binding protein
MRSLGINVSLAQRMFAHLEDRDVSRRQFLRLIGISAAATATLPLLAACGGDDDDDDDGGTTAATTTGGGESAATATTAPAAATTAPAGATSAPAGSATAPAETTTATGTGATGGEPVNDEILIFGTSVDIPNIDPAVGHDGAISETQKSLYDTLYRHMGNPAELVPWLATGHEVSEDATEWTFTLDVRAKFQDGSPVTAEAVVYSVDRVIAINKGVAWMFKGVLEQGGAVATDQQTVTFTLTKPFAPFLHATAWLFVLNPAVVEEHVSGDDMGQDWLISNAAGSGPFKIKRWEPGTLYEFESDPNYWRGWENPRLVGYIRQISRESSTKRLALEQGQMHVGDYISVEDITLLSNAPNVVVPAEPGISTYTVKMNNQRGPTADVNVRRAISYAFDYEAMLTVMEGRAVRIEGPLAPTLVGVNDDLVFYETDLDKAAEELAKSTEFADGFDIEFVYVTGLEEERKTGLILLDQLSKLNINVTITPMEWANAVALFADPAQSPEMFPIYSGTDYPDPDNFLYQAFHSSSAGTWTGASHYSNPEVDQLLEDARSTADWDKRAELYAEAQQIVVDEAAELFLFSGVGGMIHTSNVKGYQYCPVMGSGSFWYQMWIEE